MLNFESGTQRRSTDKQTDRQTRVLECTVGYVVPVAVAAVAAAVAAVRRKRKLIRKFVS